MIAIVLETSNNIVEGQEEAGIIGEVREEPARMILMHTGFGGTRMIDMLVGDPLPRIC
jgi:hydrogenase expression/formation protein HypE